MRSMQVLAARRSRAGRRRWERSRRTPVPSTAIADRPADQHRRVHPQAQRQRVGQPRRAGRRSRARRRAARSRGRGGPAAPGGRRRGRRARPTYSSSTHHRGVADQARSWVFQPNGESQLSQRGDRCPRRRAARTGRRCRAGAMPGTGARARRELAGQRGEPDGDQADPDPGRAERERPGDREPARDVRDGGQHAEHHGDARRPNGRPRPAGASRPIAVPPSSSAWPDSSSVRVCRRTTTSEHAARRTRRTARSSWSSPARRGCARRGSARRARPSAGLALIASAAVTRSAVGRVERWPVAAAEA